MGVAGTGQLAPPRTDRRRLVVMCLVVTSLVMELLGLLLDPVVRSVAVPGAFVSFEPTAVTGGVAVVGIIAMLATAVLARARPLLRLATGVAATASLDGIVLVPFSEVASHPTLLVVAVASTVTLPLLARIGLETSRGLGEPLRRSWLTTWRTTGVLAVAKLSAIVLLVLVMWLAPDLGMLVLVAGGALSIPVVLATGQAVVSGVRGMQVLLGRRPLRLRPVLFAAVLGVGGLYALVLVLPWLVMIGGGWVVSLLE